MESGDKKSLRSRCSAIAKGLSPEERAGADRRILEQVLALPEYRKADILFVYVSMEGEPDTRELIRRALKGGKRVCVPRCLSRQEMAAAEITNLEALQPVPPYGILEPRPEAPVIPPAEIPLGIIPCVSAGPDGARLGHGAGFYDRFLQEAAGMKTVCLCYRAAASEEIPMERHDRFMDRVIFG